VAVGSTAMMVIKLCKDLPQWGSLKFFWPPLKPKTTLLIFLSPPKGGVRVP